eukprot:529691_1
MLQKQINENQKNILTYIEENITHKDENKKDEYEMLQLQKQMNKIEENLSIYVDAIKSTENMSLIATSNDIADLKTQLNDIADLKIQLNDIYSLIEKMDNVDNRDMVSIKSDDSIQSKENESVKLKQEIENEKMKLNQEIEKERKEENEYKSALDYEMQQIENAIKPTDQNQNTLVSFELFQPEINKISSKIENLEYTINNIYSQSKNDEYAMLQKQINENQKNILTYIEENISHKDESKNDEYKDLLDKYNTFCGKHEELVNEFGKESTKRNKQWDEIVGKLQKEIGLVNEKLMENGMELEMYKSGQDESFKNISDSIQQKKTYDQEILGNIKNDMNKILNNVAKFNERGNKEIESLKQQLQMYEKQEDMLKYIQENIAHKDESKADEYDMLQKQMNENQKNILTYIEENISHKDESKNDE